MAAQIATNMAKKTVGKSEPKEVKAHKEHIHFVPEDNGREDINTIAKAVNKLIAIHNG